MALYQRVNPLMEPESVIRGFNNSINNNARIEMLKISFFIYTFYAYGLIFNHKYVIIYGGEGGKFCMKKIIGNIEPNNVFGYFEDICNIPHVSYHTEKIQAYIEAFAIERGLAYHKDNYGNIVVFKEASEGYEEHEPVIIQGHTDMVGASREGYEHDFYEDPLILDEKAVEEGYIKAVETTLGADDGIAVAYALAILSDDSLKHPRLEVVFTADEEVGMLGATEFDFSLLKGKTILNLDSEEEGVFLTGCAGGMRCDISIPLDKDVRRGKLITLSIRGLTGGHSGDKIGTGRPSANILMGRLLDGLRKEIDYSIMSITGGVVDNAISTGCEAEIVCDSEICIVDNYAKYFENTLKQEYFGIDDNISVFVGLKQNGSYEVADKQGTDKVVSVLRAMPQGVIMRSAESADMVDTSLNLGILRVDNSMIKMGYSLRSSFESAKRDLAERISTIAESYGGSVEISGEYPAWTYNPESKIRDVVRSVYMEQTGREPVFRTIHAGLECGLFYQNIEGADIISFGPDIYDIHTFDERLNIDSAKRVYELTVRILEKM